MLPLPCLSLSLWPCLQVSRTSWPWPWWSWAWGRAPTAACSPSTTPASTTCLRSSGSTAAAARWRGSSRTRRSDGFLGFPVSFLGLFDHSWVWFPHWLPGYTVNIILCLSVTGCVVVCHLMLSLELWISTKRIKKITWKKNTFIWFF